MAKSNQSSATVPVALNTDAVRSQSDAVATTSTASTPSGSNGPDGTNTGPADASGSVADQNLTGEGHDQTGAVSVAAPVTPFTAPSQGDADGAGANAGPSSSETTGALKVDTSSEAVAAIGVKLIEVIKEVARDYPELSSWRYSSDPAGIVRELAEENAVLKEWRDKKRASAGDDEKRYFDITTSVRLDGDLFEAGKELPLTRNQHKELAAAHGCDPDWENGE